jgi:hypothetical protein
MVEEIQDFLSLFLIDAKSNFPAFRLRVEMLGSFLQDWPILQVTVLDIVSHVPIILVSQDPELVPHFVLVLRASRKEHGCNGAASKGSDCGTNHGSIPSEPYSSSPTACILASRWAVYCSSSTARSGIGVPFRTATADAMLAALTSP